MAESLRQRAMGVLRELIADDGPLVERVAEVVGRSMEQLRQYAGMVRFLRPDAQDQLIARGAPLELVAPVTGLRGLVVERIRFYLDDELLGESTIEAGAAFFMGSFDRLGIFASRFEAVGPHETIVQEGGGTRVQVVDDAPVVLVDGDAAHVISPSRLRALVDAGFHVAWLEVEQHPKRDLRATIAERGLPDGAILTHLGEGLREQSFVIDLHATLLRTLVRRKRASGVAVCAIVSAQEHFAAQGITRVFPGRLDELDLDALRASAEALHRRRRSQDPFVFQLDEVTRTTTSATNRCHVELDNASARRAVFGAIEAAQRAIEMQLYIVEEGRFMEANVVVHDETLVQKVERWIFDAFEHSRRVDVDDAEWQRDSSRREIVARLWPDSLYS